MSLFLGLVLGKRILFSKEGGCFLFPELLFLTYFALFDRLIQLAHQVFDPHGGCTAFIGAIADQSVVGCDYDPLGNFDAINILSMTPSAP